MGLCSSVDRRFRPRLSHNSTLRVKLKCTNEDICNMTHLSCVTQMQWTTSIWSTIRTLTISSISSISRSMCSCGTIEDMGEPARVVTPLALLQRSFKLIWNRCSISWNIELECRVKSGCMGAQWGAQLHATFISGPTWSSQIEDFVIYGPWRNRNSTGPWRSTFSSMGLSDGRRAIASIIWKKK